LILSSHIKEAGYTKDAPVLRDIQFSIEPGELVGLIGPNGAGKSSTIKSLLGIMNYIDGTIEVADYSYIPERPVFYDGLTLVEHFHYLSSFLKTNEQELTLQIEKMLKEFGLDKVSDQYPEKFSKGMQQKAMILFAFLQKSSLYIIDEPFMGLDPKITKKLLKLIEEEKERGAGILMSTHVLDTAEKICDRFLLVFNGSIIAQGTLEDIRRQSGLETGSLFDCFDVLTECDHVVR
jgi:ABC-2 type transport system ATP-binding protein